MARCNLMYCRGRTKYTRLSSRRRHPAKEISTSSLATMNPAERIQAASTFLLQSPPGEINDVLNGVSMSYLIESNLTDGQQMSAT